MYLFYPAVAYFKMWKRKIEWFIQEAAGRWKKSEEEEVRNSSFFYFRKNSSCFLNLLELHFFCQLKSVRQYCFHLDQLRQLQGYSLLFHFFGKRVFIFVTKFANTYLVWIITRLNYILPEKWFHLLSETETRSNVCYLNF